MAEFIGVAVFVAFGAGVDCQVSLSTNPGVASSPKGVSRVLRSRHVLNMLRSFLGLSLRKFRLGHRSCHGRMAQWRNFGRTCQPCGMANFLFRRTVFYSFQQITLAMATWRGFPWRKVPGMWRYNIQFKRFIFF